ncbi:SagB/ThcOx family dehydrogenase [uncultured Clostridium sp.]|uniref:SagB/ThcOx family dehydrogenase n=1 Tax=uncultured Clostridium sp. TaxID=59620 RepID=UPI0028F03334|nr:SagB/ThcOx family dehydrogenase [uncultured Clostridium sp.]
MNEAKLQRQWMKSNFTEWDDIKSDQEKKLPQPPLEKSYNGSDELIDLPEISEEILKKTNILTIIKDRKSHRRHTEESLSLEELSFLLWATQGVKKVSANNYASMRTVPSGGARHPFETYLVINRVEGLKNGVYRYLALSHKLIFLFHEENLEGKLTELTLGQSFVGKSAATFIWSCIPYRGEWRYHVSAHKTMLLDAGHVCQNLYLACEAIGCRTCAIGAYDQPAIDKFLRIDGEDEFVVYIAPVGKI